MCNYFSLCINKNVSLEKCNKKFAENWHSAMQHKKANKFYWKAQKFKSFQFFVFSKPKDFSSLHHFNEENGENSLIHSFSVIKKYIKSLFDGVKRVVIKWSLLCLSDLPHLVFVEKTHKFKRNFHHFSSFIIRQLNIKRIFLHTHAWKVL